MPEFDEIIKQIKDEIKDDFHGHSRYQIENFIIGSQPTDYGRYKQCILELRSRIKNYELIKKEREKIKENRKATQEDFEKISQFEILMEDIKRESYIIMEIFEDLKKKIDLNDKESLEADFWDKKFHKELITHIFLGYPIPVNLAQNIFSLPDNSSSKKQLFGIIKGNISEIEYRKQLGALETRQIIQNKEE